MDGQRPPPRCPEPGRRRRRPRAGGVKLVTLATAYTVEPDWFRVGQPDDTASGRLLAVTFLDDGRRLHVPKATWLDLVGPAGLPRWIN